jgi:hypothetical protein
VASVTLLLPAATRIAGEVPADMARWLGRARRLPTHDAGERAQILRHFEILPRGWPAAAIARSADVGDAGTDLWLRADPAWVRAEINGARLFAVGEGLGPTQADVDALLPMLRPILGDQGYALDAPDPARWFLRMPPGSPVPAFADPADALGADVFEFLPGSDRDDELPGRRWRVLLNDVQVALHTHPRNAQRVAAGVPPINSLWFWGAGRAPDRVTSAHAVVQADDHLLCAFGLATGAQVSPLPSSFLKPPVQPSLIDLRRVRDAKRLSEDWVLPAISAIGPVDAVTLDFADGARLSIERRHRWRVWRKPVPTFDAASTQSGGAPESHG